MDSRWKSSEKLRQLAPDVHAPLERSEGAEGLLWSGCRLAKAQAHEEGLAWPGSGLRPLPAEAESGDSSGAGGGEWGGGSEDGAAAVESVGKLDSVGAVDTERGANASVAEGKGAECVYGICALNSEHAADARASSPLPLPSTSSHPSRSPPPALVAAQSASGRDLFFEGVERQLTRCGLEAGTCAGWNWDGVQESAAWRGGERT
ncbi:hypothetical protein FB451DRAFT_1376477 [Mycena latifolia]|nr:hypothetical protein FB451DRAFT_1376477 [Mycena latifolia]